jgi:hypothetical protein
LPGDPNAALAAGNTKPSRSLPMRRASRPPQSR